MTDFGKLDKLKDNGVFKDILKTAVLVLCLTGVSFNAYAAYQDGDFQIWNTNAQDIKIGKATKLNIEEEFRYAETATELFYQHYDWGFAWAFDKRFELALGYRQIYEKYKHKLRESNEPYTNLTWKQDVWKFKLEDRNRIEWRFFRYDYPDQIRYRNRVILKYPFEFRSIKIIPYTSNEIFVSSNGRGYNQNRFQSGIEFELTKYVKFDISYMLQSIRSTGDKWYEANVLWLKEKISF